MDNNDWDLSSIVRSCKATTFSDPSTVCEIPHQNLTTTITPTTNSIVSPITTTQSCFGDFIFNQEISSVRNTYTMDNDCDLSSIVRSCKATTFCEIPLQNLTTTVTTTTTNSRVPHINATTNYNFNQENSSISFAPLKPNDFIDLNKLRANFNSITHIPTPTTTNIPNTVTTTTSSLTTTPNINQENSSISFAPLKPNDFIDLNKLRANFNSITHIPTPTTTNIPNIVTTTTSSLTTTPNINQENSSISFAPLKPNDFIDLNKLRANFNSITHIPTPTTTNIPNTVTTTTSSLTTTPNIITNINTSGLVSNQNPTFFNFSTPIKQHQMQPNVFSEKDNFIPKFNLTTSCETPVQNLATTVTTTTTNSRVPHINATNNYTFNQENSSISFAPLKPNDFIDLNKLRANFNSITHIPTPTTTNIPNTVTTTTSSLTTTPNIITNISTSGLVSNQNPTFFNFSTPIKQHQMQPNIFSEKDNFIPKFNPTTSFITPKTTMVTSSMTTPTTTNHTTIIPTATFTAPTTTIIAQTITPTHPQQQNLQTGTRKNKNLETLVCHVKEDKLWEDPWQWRKYGQKPIRGSSLHSRSYYKCSSFEDCPAKKLIEKSKTEEQTYIVTYRGKHDHRKPKVKQNSYIGTTQNKSSQARLSVVEQAGSSINFKNLSSPTGSSNNNEGILIPNMSAMSEDFLLEYNHLDGGSLLLP